MHIGEVIRKYRKIRNITQEEMANRLGITAPAVNKWENGNSLPDIMLLAPIVRLLGITLDTLFSFQEELTDEEVNRLIEEAVNRLKSESYEEVFQWAKEKLEMYPNCENLLWQMAMIFDAKRLTEDIPYSEKYDNYIKKCYVRLLESKDENIRTAAADSLFEFYSRKEEYKKAEEYLSYFSNQNPEKKRKQAFIFSKTNRINEAYRTYEELLFSGYQMMNLVFHSICMLATREKDTGKAHLLVEKQTELADIFEMGEYHAVSCKLDLAAIEEDVDTAIEAMGKMISCADTICDFCKSPLYSHMSFKDPREEFLTELKDNLLDCFRDEETYGFLKYDKRWQELVK